MKKVLIAMMIVMMSVAVLAGCAPDNRNVTPTPLISPVLTPAMTPTPLLDQVIPTPGVDDGTGAGAGAGTGAGAGAGAGTGTGMGGGGL